MYLQTVTANLHRRKKAEERVQQHQSKATEARDSCILLMQEVGDMGETAQHKNIITEWTGDTAICTPSSFTSYIVRHYTETRETLVQLFDIPYCSLNEFVELRRILLTISQQLTSCRKARQP